MSKDLGLLLRGDGLSDLGMVWVAMSLSTLWKAQMLCGGVRQLSSVADMMVVFEVD